MNTPNENKIRINLNIVKRFVQLIKINRLAHAYLFIGQHESGKSETALEVAKLVNCEKNAEGTLYEACQECPSCRKIESSNHPDVYIIEAEDDKTIKIENVRDIISRMKLRPFEGRRKIYIIKDIEKLSLEGSNCLLKTLEEPTDNSFIILTTSVPEKNLDTVKSRCHQMTFFPLSQEELEQKLSSGKDSDSQSAYFYSRYAEGSLGRAKRLEEDRFFIRKNDIVDEMILSYGNEAYVKKITSEREQTKEVLDVLLSWFRDTLLLKSGDSTRLMHRDRMEELSLSSRQYTFEELDGIITEIVNAQRQLSENLNIKIPLNILKEKIWANSYK